jgi:gliding motility-associated-like protein
MDWSGNAALQDPSILATFNAWNIYRADAGVRPFTLVKVIDDVNTRFFVDSFAPNGYFVDNFVYDYQVQLVYNGKPRVPSGFCSTINLRVDSANRNESNLPIYWNHYTCIDQAVRNYDVFSGKRRDTVSPEIIWNLQNQTTDTSYTIGIPAADSATAGTYAARVVARNVNGNTRTDSSESNWVYYFITYVAPVIPPPPPTAGEVLIPNIITPNGDMINDRFFIEAPADGGVQYERIAISVYNRHGEQVFQDNDFALRNTSTAGWNGVNNAGQALSSGVYFYLIQMENPATSQSQTLQGNITINAGG